MRHLQYRVLLTMTILLAGCTSRHDAPANQEKVKTEYQCPMKCSDQVYEQPGKCPVCGTALIAVSNL